MPFTDYSSSGDSVTARLEFSMGQGTEEKLDNVHKGIEAAKTSLEAVGRFSETFLERMKQLPLIQQEVTAFHDANIKGLQTTADLEERITKTQHERLTSSAIPGYSPNPHAPTITPVPSAPGAHENIGPITALAPVMPTTHSVDPLLAPQPSLASLPASSTEFGSAVPAPPALNIPLPETPMQTVIPRPASISINHSTTPTQAEDPKSQPTSYPLGQAQVTAIHPNVTSHSESISNYLSSQNSTVYDPRSSVSNTSSPLSVDNQRLSSITNDTSQRHDNYHDTHIQSSLPYVSNIHSPVSQNISIGSSQHDPQIVSSQAGQQGAKTEIHASVVNITSSDNTHVQSQATHIPSTTATVVPSTTDGRSSPIIPMAQFTPAQHQNETHLSDTHATVPIGTLTPDHRGSAPTTPIPHVSPPSSVPSSAPRMTHSAPLPSRLQSQIDYRGKLKQEIGNNPTEIWDRLRQRGMVNTSMEHGAPKFTATIGGKQVSQEEFASNPNLHEDALDDLARSSSPQSAENAGPLKQASHVASMAKNIYQTTRSGGDASESVGKLGDFVGSMGKTGGVMGDIGGAISGAADFAGPVGIGIGAATAAYGAVQDVGQKVQGLKSEGMSAHGEGVKAGISDEAQISMMAMNPFLTTDQSRQIVMGALNTGATGKEYTSITDFMKSNLLDMNISVAGSTQLLSKNVKEGGQSIESLGVQLQTLKAAAAPGASSKTFATMQQEYTQASGQMVDSGGGGVNSGNMASQRTLFDNAPNPDGSINPLASVTGSLMTKMEASPAMQAQLAQAPYSPPGTMPQQAVGQLTQSGGINKDMATQIAKAAQQSSNLGPRAVPMFMERMNTQYNAGLTMATAQELYNSYVPNAQNGATPEAVGSQHNDQAVQAQATAAGNVTTAKGPVGKGVDGLAAIGDSIASMFTPDGTGLLAESQGHRQDVDAAKADEGSYSNRALDTVTQQYGIANTIVTDPQGKVHKVDYQDKAQMQGLQDKTWKIQGVSDPNQQDLLKKDFQGEAAKIGTSGATDLTTLASTGGNDGSASGNNNGTIGLTPEAQRWFAINQPGGGAGTPTQQSASQGANGATNNNPSPADARSSVPTG